MPIPNTRKELIDLATSSFSRLREELDGAEPDLANLPCTNEWSVKDLLAVRARWTERVVDWIEAGQRGEKPGTPAQGHRWNETPRLNADLVRAAREESYQTIRARLERGFERVLTTIDALDDSELLRIGVFPWAGEWPISRWISINTARQYSTALAFIRKAARHQTGNI